MVSVTGFRIVETEEGEKYVRLVLSGDLEMVRSENTGNFYATTRRATISSKFDEDTSQKMIGKELPGTIERVEVDPYEFELDDGTKIQIAHRWIYQESKVKDIKSKAA
jgi:hypothetical protein